MKKFKFSLWNINGLRAILKKPFLENYINSTEPDFLCLNEIRIDPKSLQDLILPPYLNERFPNKIWNSALKKGYSGVAVLTKHKPINVFYNFNFLKVKHDEGRILTLEYDDFFLICLYSPMSGRQLDRLDERINKWEVELHDYIQKLEGKIKLNR
jgi:exodeoxyribonuclease-3